MFMLDEEDCCLSAHACDMTYKEIQIVVIVWLVLWF